MLLVGASREFPHLLRVSISTLSLTIIDGFEFVDKQSNKKPLTAALLNLVVCFFHKHDVINLFYNLCFLLFSILSS